jgi:hypothetical protein
VPSKRDLTASGHSHAGARREISLLVVLQIMEPAFSPEVTGNLKGFDAGRLPPGMLVAGAMNRAVMRGAERDSEFVAHFAAERPRLQVAKMMRIGLRPHTRHACWAT